VLRHHDVRILGFQRQEIGVGFLQLERKERAELLIEIRLGLAGKGPGTGGARLGVDREIVDSRL
jgi:hypothetical protein